MSVRSRAAAALTRALNAADKKDDPVEEAKTLRRGIRTALKWLTGTHPKQDRA